VVMLGIGRVERAELVLVQDDRDIGLTPPPRPVDAIANDAIDSYFVTSSDTVEALALGFPVISHVILTTARFFLKTGTKPMRGCMSVTPAPTARRMVGGGDWRLQLARTPRLGV
jgi:hypothetical protein